MSVNIETFIFFKIFDDFFSILHFLSGLAISAFCPRQMPLYLAGFSLYEYIEAMVRYDTPDYMVGDILEAVIGIIVGLLLHRLVPRKLIPTPCSVKR